MVHASKPRGVVFVGVGIFPHRVAGDKNFLLELSGYLRRNGIPTSFVSIVSADAADPSGDFTFVNRSMHRKSDRYIRRGDDGGVIGYRHPHGVVRTWAELSFTLARSRRELRKALNVYDRAVVHWIDSSLVLPVLRGACGDKHRYVASMLRYLPQNAAGRLARRLALNRADYVLTGTDTARSLLIDEGVAPERVLVKPWGCAGRPVSPSPSRNGGTTRMLWSGFLQQIGEQDFLRSVELARRVRRDRSDIEFTFSLKPECFSAEFAALGGPGIEVIAGGPDFLEDLPRFDAFLSPVLDSRSTPAPPLTWLEALAAGLPVLTTEHRGVREVIADGVSGVVASDYEGLAARMLDRQFTSELNTMKAGAKAQHDRQYDIRSVAAGYAELYRELLAGDR